MRFSLIQRLFGCVFLAFLSAGCTSLMHSSAFSTLMPIPQSTPTAALSYPPAQNWNGRTPLVVANSKGVWVRSEPSHTAAYQGMPVLPYGMQVRVIGRPFYESVPGQWWWLVDAESGDIGWVEESSLAPNE